MKRDILFISHANPEDNIFTFWLALSLIREGYPVWCDLVDLLGGEDFWKSIDEIIREKTAKFIFVLSKASNEKIGPLQELQVAQNVQRDYNISDFIIPLHIDDLPYRKINIQLARINAIPFEKGWAEGLKILLEKLEKDGIQRSPLCSPDVVTSLWREKFGSNQGLINKGEEYISNIFPVVSLPDEIYFHELHRSEIGQIEIPKDTPYPAIQYKTFMVSFAPADDFEGKLDRFISISNSYVYPFEEFISGLIEDIFVNEKQTKTLLTHLLNIAWDKLAKEKGLAHYQLANREKCFYFTKELKENISFIGIDGKKTFRNVVGYKTIKDKSKTAMKRYWHFGIQSKPTLYPQIAYFLKPHVLFSYDGKKVLESKEYMHKARRSQCKDWWNSDWRDRILAVMTWLAGENEKIVIKVGTNVEIHVSSHPLMFVSPISYKEPEKDEDSIIELDEDDEEIYESYSGDEEE